MNITHKPVLLNEVIYAYKDVSGFIVDATLGRGGHFLELLKFHNKLIGIDADPESIEYVKKLLSAKGDLEVISIAEGIWRLKNNSDKEIYLVNDNFANIDRILSLLKVSDINGVLADLGLNMYQLKSLGRGFSFRNPNDFLDMRINRNTGPTASDLLNALSVSELSELFKNLGQVSGAKEKAQNIADYRKYRRIKNVSDLLTALDMKEKPAGRRIHPATQIFMALRIAVNQEHINLSDFLNKSKNILNKGVLSIITFHSLEEKNVISFANNNNLKYQIILPTKEEVLNNKSSRSAKLFVIEQK